MLTNIIIRIHTTSTVNHIVAQAIVLVAIHALSYSLRVHHDLRLRAILRIVDNFTTLRRRCLTPVRILWPRTLRIALSNKSENI